MALSDFLAGIADAIRSKDGTTDPIPAADFAARIGAISGGGGGGGVNTCTVRFVPYSASSSWETINPATFYGGYYYTKCVDGVISAEAVISEITSDFDITIENVVCGSFLYFSSNADYLVEDNANGASSLNTVFDCNTFVASNEPNAVCTFGLGSTSF